MEKDGPTKMLQMPNSPTNVDSFLLAIFQIFLSHFPFFTLSSRSTLSSISALLKEATFHQPPCNDPFDSSTRRNLPKVSRQNKNDLQSIQAERIEGSLYVKWEDVLRAFRDIDHLQLLLSKNDLSLKSGVRVLFEVEKYVKL